MRSQRGAMWKRRRRWPPDKSLLRLIERYMIRLTRRGAFPSAPLVHTLWVGLGQLTGSRTTEGFVKQDHCNVIRESHFPSINLFCCLTQHSSRFTYSGSTVLGLVNPFLHAICSSLSQRKITRAAFVDRLHLWQFSSVPAFDACTPVCCYVLKTCCRKQTQTC